MRRLKAGLLVALLSAGVAAGCGGGDDEPKQTKASFIVQADELCAVIAEDFQRSGGKEPKTPQDIADANNVIADVYAKLGDGLGGIELPDGADRSGAEAYVDSVQRTDPWLAKLKSSGRALVAAANGTDARALTTAGNDVRSALDGFRKARADSDLLAVQYGLGVCGNLG